MAMLTLEEYEKLAPYCEIKHEGVSVFYDTPTVITKWPINPFPFPHIYVRDVFPEDYYRQLQAALPPAETYKTLKALGRVGPNYSDARFVMPVTPENAQAMAEPFRAFWLKLAEWMLVGFGPDMLAKFEPFIQQRFEGGTHMEFYNEALLIQDWTTYSLGPHTDAPRKVLSFLFYLPADDSLAPLGTSIYVPKQPEFQCPGGPHHPFEMFDRMMTMPYLTNSLFAFVKTHNSFHGVGPITEGSARRDLLLYDIYVRNPPGLAPKPPTT